MLDLNKASWEEEQEQEQEQQQITTSAGSIKESSTSSAVIAGAPVVVAGSDESSGFSAESEAVTHQFFPAAVELRGPPPSQPLPTAAPPPAKRTRRGPRSRSSQYRGVTFYRRTGRWESHIWDCGKQVYLGGFDTAHVAARAYDRAAIKFRGVDADINFSLEDYEEDLKQMGGLTKEEFVHTLRRQSAGSPKGSSKFRGVTLHKCGRWEARMGQFPGKKYVYLGLFDTEEEAARAHDRAMTEFNGREVATNYDPRLYEDEAKSFGGHIDHDLDLCLGNSGSRKNKRLQLDENGNNGFIGVKLKLEESENKLNFIHGNIYEGSNNVYPPLMFRSNNSGMPLLQFLPTVHQQMEQYSNAKNGSEHHPMQMFATTTAASSRFLPQIVEGQSAIGLQNGFFNLLGPS